MNLTMPSFHLIDVADIFVMPSSLKVKVFVSLVSSKNGLEFLKVKEKKNISDHLVESINYKSTTQEALGFLPFKLK